MNTCCEFTGSGNTSTIDFDYLPDPPDCSVLFRQLAEQLEADANLLERGFVLLDEMGIAPPGECVVAGLRHAVRVIRKHAAEVNQSASGLPDDWQEYF